MVRGHFSWTPSHLLREVRDAVRAVPHPIHVAGPGFDPDMISPRLRFAPDLTTRLPDRDWQMKAPPVLMPRTVARCALWRSGRVDANDLSDAHLSPGSGWYPVGSPPDNSGDAGNAVYVTIGRRITRSPVLPARRPMTRRDARRDDETSDASPESPFGVDWTAAPHGYLEFHVIP